MIKYTESKDNFTITYIIPETTQDEYEEQKKDALIQLHKILSNTTK